jgi:hypothetical protein
MSEAGGILGPRDGPDLLVRMRGRAVGAMVCAGFGAYALYWWVQDAIQGERIPWFGAIAVDHGNSCCLVDCEPCRPAPRATSCFGQERLVKVLQNRLRADRRDVEGAAISVGGPILGHFHRPDLFGQWIGAVVGIHFFPLGKLFKMPLYYGTGAAISLAAFGSLLISASPTLAPLYARAERAWLFGSRRS